MEDNQLCKIANNNVVRIEKDELSLNYIYYPESKNLNNIGVISNEYVLPKLIKAGYYFSPDHIKPSIGDTYIKDPFNEKRFIRIENFAQEVLHSKQSCIMRVAALLAAKHVELTVKVTNVETRKKHLNVNGGYLETNGQLDVDRTKVDQIAQSLTTTADFKTELTNEGYNQAVEEAKKCGLYNEHDVNNLLFLRSPDKKTDMTSYNVHFVLTNEINNSLDIALELNYMKDVFKLNSSFNHSVDTKYTLEGSMKMTF